MLVCPLTEVIVITTKEVQKEVLKLDVKLKLDVVCIQEEADMGTADALRHIQQKIKVSTATQFPAKPPSFKCWSVGKVVNGFLPAITQGLDSPGITQCYCKNRH